MFPSCFASFVCNHGGEQKEDGHTIKWESFLCTGKIPFFELNVSMASGGSHSICVNCPSEIKEDTNIKEPISISRLTLSEENQVGDPAEPKVANTDSFKFSGLQTSTKPLHGDNHDSDMLFENNDSLGSESNDEDEHDPPEGQKEALAIQVQNDSSLGLQSGNSTLEGSKTALLSMENGTPAIDLCTSPKEVIKQTQEDDVMDGDITDANQNEGHQDSHDEQTPCSQLAIDLLQEGSGGSKTYEGQVIVKHSSTYIIDIKDGGTIQIDQACDVSVEEKMTVKNSSGVQLGKNNLAFRHQKSNNFDTGGTDTLLTAAAESPIHSSNKEQESFGSHIRIEKANTVAVQRNFEFENCHGMQFGDENVSKILDPEDSTESNPDFVKACLDLDINDRDEDDIFEKLTDEDCLRAFSRKMASRHGVNCEIEQAKRSCILLKMKVPTEQDRLRLIQMAKDGTFKDIFLETFLPDYAKRGKNVRVNLAIAVTNPSQAIVDEMKAPSTSNGHKDVVIVEVGGPPSTPDSLGTVSASPQSALPGGIDDQSASQSRENTDSQEDLPVQLHLGILQQPTAKGQAGDTIAKVLEQLLELESTLFTKDVLGDRYEEMRKSFLSHKALLKDIRGSFLFLLTFLHKTHVDRFYHNHYRVGEGTLSQQLSHILISDDLQVKVKDAKVIVRLQVKHEDYVRVRDRLGQGLDRTTSVNNLLALPPPSRHVDDSCMRGLDLAVISKEDQPCPERTDNITTLYRQVQSAVRTAREKSKQEVQKVKVQLQTMQGQMQTGRMGVDAMMKEVKMLKEKNEKAEKILLEKEAETYEKIQRLQETNKSLEARIGELLTAKQPVTSGSQQKDPGKEEDHGIGHTTSVDNLRDLPSPSTQLQESIKEMKAAMTAKQPVDSRSQQKDPGKEKDHGIEELYRSAIREDISRYYERQLCQQQVMHYNEEFTLGLEDIFITMDILSYNMRHQAFDRRPIESIADIFDPKLSRPSRILIWGDPGIGKTTVIAKLLAEWNRHGTDRSSSEGLQKYDLVFAIALRKVGKQQSLVDCIFDQLLPEDDGDVKEVLANYLGRTDRVLIILDGYDELEWQPEDDHDITKLLTGRLFPNTSVIVTTRPTYTSELITVMKPDTKVEVLGFSPNNVKSYILKFFGTQPSQGEALLEKIGLTHLNTGILSVPIFLLQACLMWRDNKDVLMTDKIYPLYDQVVSWLLRRYSQDKTGDIQTLIHPLAQLAFEFLLKEKTVFGQEGVIRYCGENFKILVQLGMLKEQKSPSRLNPVVQFSFTHKTMQEYFAAQCLSESLTLEGTRREILRQHFPTLRAVQTYGDLLVFTCGKLGQKAKFVLHHLLDSHSKADVHLVEEEFYNFFATGKSKNWNKDIKLEDFVRQEDLNLQFASQWNDYPHVLLAYQSYIELYLLCCHESGLTAQFAEQVFQRNTIQFSNASPRVYNVLSHMIAEGSEKMRKMEHLHLVNSQNYVLGPTLEELHKLSGLTELNLRQSQLGRHIPKCTIPKRLELRFKYRRLVETSEDDLAKAPSLLARQLPHLRLMKKLVISWNNLSPKDMKQLLPAIQTLTDLELLFLSGNDLGGLGKDVADLVAFLPKLKEFKVYFCQLTFNELQIIASRLTEFCPDLQLFDFQLNPIQPDESIWIGERELDMVKAALRSEVFVPSGAQKLPPSKPLQDPEPPPQQRKLIMKAIPMRGYQMELAIPALEGRNTIICAPTGSGKTHVAIKITREHLEGATANGGASVGTPRCVAFMVNKVPLVNQQYNAFLEYLIPKYDILPLSGETAADIPVGETLPEHDVIILTAQMLESALRDGLVTLDTFSMLIFDECHHCQKNDPYNAIMTRYIKQKWDEKSSTKLPQIIGLTASLGVGKAKSLKDTVEHILKACANLDAEWISQVVEHKDELLAYMQKPDEEEKAVTVSARSEDPFANKINKIMEDIEKTLALEVSTHLTPEDLKPPWQREKQAYEQWLVTLARKGATLKDETTCRVIHAATIHLRKYTDALAINADARTKDALHYLDRFMTGLQREGIDSTHEDLVKHFTEARMELQEYAADPKYSNPKLDQLKYMILQVYEEKPDSRCLLCCKTSALTFALLTWMQEDEALGKLNPGRLVVSGVSESIGGMRAKQLMEEAMLKAFTTRGHKIVISTSVAEESPDFVFRYDYVGNEIGKLNTVQKLMEKAMLQVRYMQRGKNGDFMKEVRRLQLEELELERKPKKVCGKGMKLLCVKCKGFACNASDLRKIKENHHVVVDKTFPKRIIIRPHPPKKIDDWEMNGKVYCRNCRQDWGIHMVYRQASFPTLKIESFVLEKSDGMRLTCRKWKKAPFEADDITPDDISGMLETPEEEEESDEVYH